MITANVNKKSQNIPPGISDNNTEIFASGDSLKAFHNGEILDFEQFPLKIINFIKEIYNKDHIAKAALTDWGITKKSERLKQYGKCMFGGLDNIPDLLENGEFQDSEYWDCGERGHCPYEGKICKPVKVKNGILTITEIDVVNVLALGDKETVSAQKLGISFNTLVNHKTAINKKFGTHTKFNTLLESLKRNIISYVW